MLYEYSLLGLIISVGFIWLTGIYPGGIIVPFYLVLFINQPLRIATTVAIALVTVALYRLSGRFIILFGRRRFLFMIICGGLVSWFFHFFFTRFYPLPLELRAIGMIIPGLMANQCERQGVLLTLASLAIVLVLTWLAGTLVFQVVL